MEALKHIVNEIKKDKKPYALKVARELEEQSIGNRVVLEDAATCLRDDCAYIRKIATQIDDVLSREWGEGELTDWYINSVSSNDVHKWTEEHIRQLLEDFHVIRKLADEDQGN